MSFKIIIIITTMTFYGCNTHKKPIIIGHRGAMGHETENTLASVQKALDLGVDIVEIDVSKCKSGEIVVFHDERVDVLTNAAGAVKDLNIIQLKILTVKGGHKIPLLQDMLKLVNRKCKINIELKGEGTADKVNHILNYYIKDKGWKPEDFIISSFDWKELQHFYMLNKEIPIGVLTEENPLNALNIAEELHALSIHPNHKTLTKENVKAIQKENFKVYTWTVNNPLDFQKVENFGVDGIITDFPERAK
jgi:glycerophosphoryl diester phosphodiesterase